jgi:hypothetical protein
MGGGRGGGVWHFRSRTDPLPLPPSPRRTLPSSWHRVESRDGKELTVGEQLWHR